MREFKKYFFETLIQLTILANVFRENNRHTTNINFNNNNNNNYSINNDLLTQTYSSNELELLLLNDNLNNFNNNQSDLNNNYRVKETEQYLNDIRSIERLNKLLNRRSSSPSYTDSNIIVPNTNNHLFIAPASFSYNTNNQKDLNRLGETRLLLNSIEANSNSNNNQFSKEEFEMEIDIQTILQQDIDLGIQNSLCYDFDVMGCNSGKDLCEQTCDLLKKKENFYQLENQEKQLESQKNSDILAVTEIFRTQAPPEGYKMILEEDTGECFLLLIDNGGESNKTNETSDHFELKDIESSLFNLTCLDENNSSCSEDYGLSALFDSSNSNFQPKQESAHSDQLYTNENSTNLVHSAPAFLSQQSVALELNKLSNQSLEMNGLLDTAPKLDDLLGYNETWVKNYFPNESILNDNSTQPKMVNYEPTYIDSQLINISNNQSLLDMNNNQSILKTQDDQYELLARQQSELDSNGNTIQNLLSDDAFLSNIEEDIKLFEAKNQNGIQNLSNQTFDFLINNTQFIDLDVVQLANFVLDHDKAKNFFETTSSSNNSNISSKFEPINELSNEPQQQASTISTIVPKSNLTATNKEAALAGFKHNHTYLEGGDSSEANVNSYHPYSYKNKIKKMLTNLKNKNENSSKHFESKDELLLKENGVSLDITQIVDTNAEEFNDLLKNGVYSQEQINLIKDIRRRGKNKIAAQICRKRKIDSIDSLKEDVEQLTEMRSMLESEYNSIHNEIKEMTLKFDNLYKETMGSNADANDPIFAFINNLKTELSSPKFQNKYQPSASRRYLNSEESDSLSNGFDDEQDDETEDEDSSLDLSSDSSNSDSKFPVNRTVNSSNKDGASYQKSKKFKKF